MSCSCAPSCIGAPSLRSRYELCTLHEHIPAAFLYSGLYAAPPGYDCSKGRRQSLQVPYEAHHHLLLVQLGQVLAQC
jgi:hypothetical protein